MSTLTTLLIGWLSGNALIVIAVIAHDQICQWREHHRHLPDPEPARLRPVR